VTDVLRSSVTFAGTLSLLFIVLEKESALFFTIKIKNKIEPL
jgi:hypothetical protein